MSEARITLNPRIKLLADELLLLTGVNNFSNLFALLLTRYGYHLKNSWVLNASMQSASIQQPPTPRYELPSSAEPTLELPQTEDPVILRLRGLIEEF
jgi:hypothetical protein